ncbi:MAG: N-6 DNA methylase, partial [Chloroflexota bacterium]|nr:N-6 DNA methylase [Chloroflexota bacterium]
DELNPKVRCILQLRNAGAGIPDGGLFTQDQLRRVADSAPMLNLLPGRGAIEVKSPAEELEDIARGEQVARYVDAYGQVLVTNLRAFALVGREEGRPVIFERYVLADSEAAFWSSPGLSPVRAVELHGERFVEYLKRVMLQPAALSSPKDVAWFLASYARDAMLRIEQAPVESGALGNLRRALEESLGLAFEGEKGDHFFRSTLVQTLFYGVFSGWVLWSARTPVTSSTRFDWKDAGWELQVPVIRALFHQITNPQTLKPLRLDEVLDWAGAALNRVDRTAFFEKFEEELAVQHFYEPFLEAFDPELRRQMGVWYTPKEVVQYMVARVDIVLREELGIANGLADESVYILDPATGTGSYLVEVVKTIDRRLRENGGDALTAHDVKRAAMTRVLGFELLPAPFVVAHLQLGLLLTRLGAPLADELDERVGVYLTNALTGWDASEHPRQRTFFDELEAERTAADGVKRATPILVILGNPPYNGYAGIAMDEERDLGNAYRKATRTRQPQGQGLNDLYVRFFRMAERKIVEGTGRGIVCYISNYSWLDGLSHTAMRERYLDAFDRIWIDNLNGDKYKTGKVTPWGEPDPSIFSAEWNREGIQIGTAVALLARTGADAEHVPVRYRDFWGRTKRADLLTALEDGGPAYDHLAPPNELGLPFTPLQTEADYLTWPLLPDLFPTSFPGVKTSRDDVVVDIDRERLVERME